MNEPQKYKCQSCGETHSEWPAIAFWPPDNYIELSDKDKSSIAEFTSDYCIITYPDQTDRFIRCTLIQEVNDSCQDLNYGLWVSLSEASFQDYVLNIDNQNHEGQYFGWLCNALPGYDFNISIPTTVLTHPNGNRPEIFPHKETDHPFVRDYYNGITLDKAVRRISEVNGN